VIFFGRFEASQFGSPTIETEHLLLGLLREDKDMANRFFSDLSSTEHIREEITARTTVREKISTSVDLPLSNECKRILAYAAEEAAGLKHRDIGTEHLLLGILREEKCLAARVLSGRGLRLDAARESVSVPVENPLPLRPGPEVAIVRDQETAKRIAEAIWLAAYGGQTAGGVPTADLIPRNVWRVTAGPLFAYIQGQDGKVLSMGMAQLENPGV